MLGIFVVDGSNNVIVSHVDSGMREHLRHANVDVNSVDCSTSGFSDDSQLYHSTSSATSSTSSYCDISYRLLPLVMLYRAKEECDSESIQKIRISNKLVISIEQLENDLLLILFENDTGANHVTQYLIERVTSAMNLCFGPLIADSTHQNVQLGMKFPPEVRTHWLASQFGFLIDKLIDQVAPTRFDSEKVTSHTLPGFISIQPLSLNGKQESFIKIMQSFTSHLQTFFDNIRLCVILEDGQFLCTRIIGECGVDWLANIQQLDPLTNHMTPCGFVQSNSIYHMQAWLTLHNQVSLYDYFIIELDSSHYISFLCDAHMHSHLATCAKLLKQAQNGELDPEYAHRVIQDISSTNSELIKQIKNLSYLLIKRLYSGSKIINCLIHIIKILQSTSLLVARTYRTENVAKLWSLKPLLSMDLVKLTTSHTRLIPSHLGLDMNAFIVVCPERHIQVGYCTQNNNHLFQLALEYCNINTNSNTPSHPRFLHLSVDSVDDLYVLISVSKWKEGQVSLFKKSKWMMQRLGVNSMSSNPRLSCLAAFEPYINHALAVRQTKQLLTIYSNHMHI